MVNKNKGRYAVLKGRRERDIVRPPAPVQITPELPSATALYSGIESRIARNLVGFRGSRGNADLYPQVVYQVSFVEGPDLLLTFTF